MVEQIDNGSFCSARIFSVMDRQQKITFGEMCAAVVRGVLVCCSDYKCGHSIALDADLWPDEFRLSDIEDRFVCEACGKRGADVRPHFLSAEMGSGK